MWRDDLIRRPEAERIIPLQRASAVCRAGFRGASAVALLLVLIASSLSAQDSLSSPPSFRSSPLLGVGGNYGLGKAFGQFLVYEGGSATCGLFDDGRTRASGGAGELRLPGMFGDRLGLSARLNVSALSEEFSAIPVGSQRIADSGEAPRSLRREFRFRSAFTVVSADVLLLWKIGDRLSLRAGPSFGYRFSETFEQYDTLYGTDVFENGATRKRMLDGEQFSLRPFAFGLVAGAGYMLPVGARFSIEPEISLRLDVQGPVREVQRSTLGASLGLSFFYALGSGRSGNIPAVADIQTSASTADGDISAVDGGRSADAPSPVDSVESSLSPLGLSLDVYSLDSVSVRSDTAVIPVRTVREMRFVALLPRLYFEQGRDEIPSRYPLLDAASASTFTLDSVRRVDPERINSDLLNIVGKRLKDNPGTSVRLSGSVSIDETRELAEKRVRSVASYLREIWNIDDGRIRLAEAETTYDPVDNGTVQGREEQRYVEVEFLPDALAAPVIIEQDAHEFLPPGIKLSPSVDSDAELESWEITIRQGGAVVARYSSDAEGQTPSGIPWNVVAGENVVASASLVAELNARDNLGRQGAARDTLPVIFVPDDSAAGLRERLFFILPGLWGAVVSDQKVEQETKKIAELLRGGERIRIHPRYSGTDRFATERSLALAKAIGESLLEKLEEGRLPVADIVIETSSDEADPSALGTPEHRIAGRGVVVVIERM